MKIAVSPAQRYMLLELAHPASTGPDGMPKHEQIITSSLEGRRYRRFLAQLHLDHIGATVRKYGGVSFSQSKNEDDRQIFDVESDTVEFILTLAERPRSAFAEDILGDLFDTLLEVRAGRTVDLTNIHPAVFTFNPEEDRKAWLPPQALKEEIDTAELPAPAGTEEPTGKVDVKGWLSR